MSPNREALHDYLKELHTLVPAFSIPALFFFVALITFDITSIYLFVYIWSPPNKRKDFKCHVTAPTR